MPFPATVGRSDRSAILRRVASVVRRVSQGVLLLLWAAIVPERLFAADRVSLHLGEQTLKIVVDDEALGAYQFHVGRKKPFLLPVAAPGGVALLAAELGRGGDSPDGPGDAVSVVQEQASLFEAPGEGAPGPRAEFGDRLTVVEVQAPWLRVAEHNAWIHQHDVVPFKAMVARMIDDHPPQDVDRLHPRYYDHPHHTGVWAAVDQVNGVEFWKEDGEIINQSVEVLTPSGDSAAFRVVNHWLDHAGSPLLIETTRIDVFPGAWLAYDMTFTAVKPVEFGDTKEGLFGIRLPNSMREFAGGGPVTNADGLSTTAGCWGRTSRWVDYAGPVGGQRFAVAVFDHPGNFRPSRYHVRDYGLFSISPFGESAYTNGQQPAAPVRLNTEESLRLRYGLYIRREGPEAAAVSAIFERFTGLP